MARSENMELKALYDEVCRNTANLEAEIGQMKTDHTHAINAVKREYEDAQCILLSKLTNPEVGFDKCFVQRSTFEVVAYYKPLPKRPFIIILLFVTIL